jgi:hypothetical protein
MDVPFCFGETPTYYDSGLNDGNNTIEFRILMHIHAVFYKYIHHRITLFNNVHGWTGARSGLIITVASTTIPNTINKKPFNIDHKSFFPLLDCKFF